MRAPLLFCAFLVAINILQADDVRFEDLAIQLREAAAAEARKTNNVGKKNENSPYLRNLPDVVQRSREFADLRELTELVQKIQADFSSVEVNRLSAAVLEQASFERIQMEQKAIDSLNASVAKVMTNLLAFKKPADLDKPIQDLGKATSLQVTLDSSRKALAKSHAALRFLCEWQNYLVYVQAGNAEKARQILEALLRDNQPQTYVPRSKILELMTFSTAPTLPQMKGKTLRDCEALLEEVQALRAKYPQSEVIRDFSYELAALYRADCLLEVGLTAQAIQVADVPTYGRDAGQLASLRQEILVKALPVYLNVAKSYPVNSGETSADYLQRVGSEARKKGDWLTVWKTLHAFRTIQFSENRDPKWLASDIEGIALFLAGQNLEKAEQYTDAVRAYRRVLLLTGDHLPLQETTASLTSLQKKYPEAYEAALKSPEPLPAAGGFSPP